MAERPTRDPILEKLRKDRQPISELRKREGETPLSARAVRTAVSRLRAQGFDIANYKRHGESYYELMK